MRNQDDWGQDPSVQSMRKVFVRMERAQKEFLAHMNISSFDGRLRHWREETLVLFEQTWALANRKGAVLKEDEVASLYIHCLAQALSLDGIHIPPEALPHDEKIIGFLKEGSS